MKNEAEDGLTMGDEQESIRERDCVISDLKEEIKNLRNIKFNEFYEAITNYGAAKIGFDGVKLVSESLPANLHERMLERYKAREKLAKFGAMVIKNITVIDFDKAVELATLTDVIMEVYNPYIPNLVTPVEGIQEAVEELTRE